MTEQTKAIVEVLRELPYGRVVTYGQVARMAGYPRGARQVSWTLRSQRNLELPWHRVIGAGGQIRLDGAAGVLQKELLISEGVEVGSGGKVDLKRFGL